MTLDSQHIARDSNNAVGTEIVACNQLRTLGQRSHLLAVADHQINSWGHPIHPRHPLEHSTLGNPHAPALGGYFDLTA